MLRCDQILMQLQYYYYYFFLSSCCISFCSLHIFGFGNCDFFLLVFDAFIVVYLSGLISVHIRHISLDVIGD